MIENLEEMKALLKKYERALEEEVWYSKLGKFLPFKEFPNVKKILDENVIETPEQKSE